MAATDLGDRVEQAITHATGLTSKQLTAAEREAQRYSADRSPPDSEAGGFTG